MSVAACAELVAKGDPDRFLAAMAAPPSARERLFPLYAFNLEIARAPWVASEPAIGEMRLTFWRETLDEIAAGAPPRAHEVARPLAEMVRATGLPVGVLDDMVVARWADLARQRFETAGALADYLDATAGNLMWASVLALGGAPSLEDPARRVGRAGGLAGWLLAAPELAARGWPAEPPGLEPLIGAARSDLDRARGQRFGSAVPALRTAWRAGAVLKRAARDPAAIAEGRLAGSEFARRGSLLVKTLTGRW